MTINENAKKFGDHVPLSGSERVPLPTASVKGQLDSSEEIKVTLELRSKSSDEQSKVFNQLNSMSAKIEDRNYLSHEEVAEKFGADPDDIRKVEDFATGYGLKVLESSIPKRLMILSGTIDAFNEAFDVKLERYKYAGGEYRGRTGHIKIPKQLESIILGVYGLDDRKQVRPFFISQKSITKLDSASANLESQPYTPDKLAKIYNFPTELDGSGQCIGILEFGGGFKNTDLQQFFNKLNMPVPDVQAFSVGGATNNPDNKGLNGNDGEVLLDIEVIGSIAPKAKIVVYFAENSDPGFINAFRTAIHDTDNRPSIISVSWGAAEKYWTPRTRDAINQSCKEASSMGITICCASGDDGSSSERPAPFNNFEIDDDSAHGAFPASSPFILACGGTKLESSGNTIDKETVWNENSIGGGASGGGVSDVFDIPDYQNNVDIPSSVNPGGRQGRGIPDVSGNAAGIPGYDVLVDGQEGGVGGTSAVAPLWAGLIALINQSVGRKMGFINPVLYNIASDNATKMAFRDITSGNNTVIEPVRGKGRVTIKGYNAKVGWDPCTGLGSPDGEKLLNVLKGS
jgi:kumamolisin